MRGRGLGLVTTPGAGSDSPGRGWRSRGLFPTLLPLGFALLLPACDRGADRPLAQVADWEGIPLLEAEVVPFGAGAGDAGAGEAGAGEAGAGDAGAPMEGRDAASFELVGGIARDAQGRTFVVATGGDEIRVFGADDAFLFSFGFGGEARGRLLGACCPAVGPDGLLWVRDRGNGRYQAFEVGEAGAEVRRVIPIQHSAATLWAPTTFDERGRLVDVGLQVDQDTRNTRPVRVHMSRTTGEVEGVAGLPQPPEARMGRASVTADVDGRESTVYVYQPHGPRSLLAHGPGGRWAEAVSDTYAVRLAGPDGSLREIVGPGDAGPPLTEAERAEARGTLEGYRERLGLAEDEIPFGVPDRKPPLRSLFFDREGRLWVELATGEGMREAHVYDPEGRPVARYAWPDRVLLDVRAWIGSEEAIGVEPGTSLERPVRLRLPAPGGP